LGNAARERSVKMTWTIRHARWRKMGIVLREYGSLVDDRPSRKENPGKVVFGLALMRTNDVQNEREDDLKQKTSAEERKSGKVQRRVKKRAQSILGEWEGNPQSRDNTEASK